MPYSISLPPDLVNWIDEHYSNRSQFVTDAVTAYRDKHDNHEIRLMELKRQRDEVLNDLEVINREIDEVKKLREEAKARKEREEDSSKEELKELFMR